MTEELFKNECKKELPDMIMVKDRVYKLDAIKILDKELYRISYAEFINGYYYWDNMIIDLFFRFGKPTSILTYVNSLIDGSHHVSNMDEVINIVFDELSKFRKLNYKIIENNSTEFEDCEEILP